MSLSDGMIAFRKIAGCLLRACIPHHQTIKAQDSSFTRECHQLNLFLIARFESYGSCGRNIQMIAKCGISVEFQVTINFKEMEM